MNKQWTAYLTRLGACNETIEWARTFDSPAAAWAACKRGDWMLWLLGRTAGPPRSKSRRKLVLTACACAHTALPLFEKVYPKDSRPRKAIETAEQWAKGTAGVSLADVRKAAYAAANAAADTAYAAAQAAYAAYAAAYAAAQAAYAAYAAAYAAAQAADTAYAAAQAAYAAAYAANAAADTAYAAAVRAATLTSCADIVRKHYPTPPPLP